MNLHTVIRKPISVCYFGTHDLPALFFGREICVLGLFLGIFVFHAL